jgi:hypothetical protein
MAQNNHSFIDILKIDIEGAEFEIVEALIDVYPFASSTSWFSDKGRSGRAGGGLPFGQLQLEIHVRDNIPWTYFPRFLLWWEKLEKAGLRPFWTEPNLVYINLVRGVRPDVVEVSALCFRSFLTSNMTCSTPLSTFVAPMSSYPTFICHPERRQTASFVPSSNRIALACQSSGSLPVASKQSTNHPSF